MLNSLNTRLDAAVARFQLDHGEAKVLITDREFSGRQGCVGARQGEPLIIDYNDAEFAGPGERLGRLEYEDFLRERRSGIRLEDAGDEWDAIALNYTSGTTGDPKGVVFTTAAPICSRSTMSHRGMGQHPVYLWTLPMFHCNGWCFPWTLSVVAGTHVCLRAVRAKPIYDLIAEHKVTHLCGAPIVMSTLLNAPDERARPLPPASNSSPRGAAAGIRAGGDERGRIQCHACLRPD